MEEINITESYKGLGFVEIHDPQGLLQIADEEKKAGCNANAI